MKRFGESARYALLFASVCAAPFAMSSPAFAQDGASEDDIVVTARRREENLQDVPIAITVQTAEQLDQRGADNLTVLQQVTPNATVQIARGSNSTLIAFIRGVGQQDPLWALNPASASMSTTFTSRARKRRCSTFSTSSALKCCAARKARSTDATRSAARSAT